MKFILPVLFISLSCGALAGWEDYKQKTLRATIAENRHLLGTAELNYTPGLPQLVLATYQGEKRRIPWDRERVMRSWIKMIGQTPDTGDLFLTEMKFTEDGKTFWLAIQRPLIHPLEKALKPNDKVWLYTIWVGATRTEWVFAINDFRSASVD